MSDASIAITVQTQFLNDQSDPAQQRFAFGYTITIRNNGKEAAQLLSRHWIITDSDGNVQEVRGKGVVGEQPRIPPGESFSYSSGAVIPTPVGSMHGTYTLINDHGDHFEATIPAFRLAIPGLVN